MLLHHVENGELGGREEIGTKDREGINPPEYFANGYYVNERWLVWALGVLLFIGFVNKARLRYEADRKTIKLDMTYLDRHLHFTSEEQRRPMVQYVLSQCLNRNLETRWMLRELTENLRRRDISLDRDRQKVEMATSLPWWAQIQHFTLEPDGEIHINLQYCAFLVANGKTILTREVFFRRQKQH